MIEKEKVIDFEKKVYCPEKLKEEVSCGQVINEREQGISRYTDQVECLKKSLNSEAEIIVGLSRDLIDSEQSLYEGGIIIHQRFVDLMSRIRLRTTEEVNLKIIIKETTERKRPDVLHTQIGAYDLSGKENVIELVAGNSIEAVKNYLTVIKALSLANLNEIDRKRVESLWDKSINTLANRLAMCACGMYEVYRNQADIETEFDQYYLIMCNYIYELSKCLDLSGKHASKDLVQMEQSLSDETLNYFKSAGLKFARWGSKDRDFTGEELDEHSKSVARFCTLYRRLKSMYFDNEKHREKVIKMIEKISNVNLKNLKNEVIRVLNFGLFESLLLSGTEEMYEHLELPEWIERFKSEKKRKETN